MCWLLLFQNEMQNFTKLIVDMVKEEKLFASQGGPIILAQIENEYGNVQEPYGDAGKAYVQWCSNMAQSLNVGVPWIMCQQPDAPQPMVILFLYDYYFLGQYKKKLIKSYFLFPDKHVQWLLL